MTPSCHNNAVLNVAPFNNADCATLLSENAELKRELVQQWEVNHAEHCGVPLENSWPVHGSCHWELPASISPNEAYLILLEASGVSFGLHLRSLER